jgi:hypothetical protein
LDQGQIKDFERQAQARMQRLMAEKRSSRMAKAKKKG